MQLVIRADNVIAKFSNQLGALGNDAPKAMQRAVAHTGDKARTQVVRALTSQTGLPRAVIVRAVRVTRPDYRDFSYVMIAKGGNVRLKYFRPRETRKGVTAAVQGGRKLFPATFMRAGWVWGRRIDKPAWNGQVFRRAGGFTSTGMDKFEVVRSGVYIPLEMVGGATERAWREVADRDLEARLRHEIGRLLPR